MLRVGELRMKYFVINKELDYQRGYLEQAQYRMGALGLSDGALHGAFFSRVFDGREEGLAWHRFTMKGHGPGTASVQLSFYSSDSLELRSGNRRLDIPELLRDSTVALEEKKELLSPLLKKRALFPADILLHEVRGRYLFFLAELFSQGGEGPRLGKMTLFFPREDWLKYLPGLYRREAASADFLARYLGIFQSFYDDCGRRIFESGQLLSPEAAGKDWLEELAGWFGLPDIYLWPEDKLRELLKMLPRLLEETGTVRGMLDMVRLYTGETPLLLECARLSGLPGYVRLYGDEPYRFVLLVKEEHLASEKDYQALLCVVGQMKPAHMEVRLVPLRQRLILGESTYLGINSALRGSEPVRLDGHSALAFAAVGQGMIKEEGEHHEKSSIFPV